MQGYLHMEPKPLGLAVDMSFGSTQLRYKPKHVTVVVLISALQHSHG